MSKGLTCLAIALVASVACSDQSFAFKQRFACFGTIGIAQCSPGSFALCVSKTRCKDFATGRSFLACSRYNCIHLNPSQMR